MPRGKHFFQPTVTIAIILTLSLTTHVVQAREIQSLEEIANTARAYVYAQMNNSDANIEVNVGQMDSRLRLQQCSRALEAFNPGYEARRGLGTVGVCCNGERPWSLYVPVTVKVFKKVAVLKRPVSRNTPLTADDIVFEKTNVNRLNSGYFTELDDIKGKILTQNLAPGTVLTQYLLKSPMAMKQGQLVTLVAKNSAIEVRAEGKALSRGAIGDRIRVKNIKTDRIVEGVILNNQLINVNL